MPAVRVVFDWRTSGADHLAGRFARERKLQFSFVANRDPGLIAKVSANAIVVFDGGRNESDALMQQARAAAIPLHVVNVRKFVTPARL
jgi:hypothetical protein